MANTYTQIHLHIICVVKFRQALIGSLWKESLHKYITGIIQKRGHKMVSINSVQDHLHMMIGLRPVQALSDLMEEVKSGSSGWINDHKLAKGYFNWQKGFSAFSVSMSQVPIVVSYIMNQEEHHRKKSFREEYLALLKENDIEYDERYIFSEPE